MASTTTINLPGQDGKLIHGNFFPGRSRQILFVNGFLSKRWGTKSHAVAQFCQNRSWGFCCFDYRGNGDSEGRFSDYTLSHWLEDGHTMVEFLSQGPPLTIIGSSLGGWLAWLLARDYQEIDRLLLLAPAFNMMGQHALDISHARRTAWQEKGLMPWDDDAAHKDFPLSWKWVVESESFWKSTFDRVRRLRTTILHGLQDTVIIPQGSWEFSRRLLTRDPDFPLELIFQPGDHRFSSPDQLQTLLDLLHKN